VVYSLYSVTHDDYFTETGSPNRLGFGELHDAITMDATEIYIVCSSCWLSH
jgi:hypothetical protein